MFTAHRFVCSPGHGTQEQGQATLRSIHQWGIRLFYRLIDYFTDIQYLDSASLNDKGLLDGRSQYSIQLKDYLESRMDGKNRTCFIFFHRKKKNLQKEMSKLRQKYQKNSTLVVKEVNPDFKFEKAELYE